MSQAVIGSFGLSQIRETTDHVLAKCLWDSLFDDQPMAYQLQEYLSYFSQTKLLQILERVFDQYTSPNQTLRMEELVLDLGVLQFRDLETQLERKIESCLSTQLSNLLVRADGLAGIAQESKASLQETTGTRLIDQSQSQSDFIQIFLLSGIAPWWYRGKRSSKQIFLKQLSEAPGELASSLRVVAKNEAARKRILWQWEIEGLEKIVVLLEPLYHQDILGFAEFMGYIDKRLELVDARTEQLNQHLLLWALTFIVLERGAQFNNETYVEFMLRKCASIIKLDYLELLNKIQTLDFANDEKLSTFVGLQKAVTRQRHSGRQKPLQLDTQKESNLVELQQLQQLLLGESFSAQNRSRLASLLLQLQSEDAEGLTSHLRKIGNKTVVQHNLATALEKPDRISIVSLLSPGNQIFIANYAGHLEQVAIEHNQAPSLVWEVIFGYLLADNGSAFNRQQFVAETLIRLSKKHGVAYDQLLALLLHYSTTNKSTNSSGGAQPFELQHILLSLQKKTPQSRVQQVSKLEAKLDCYLQAVMHYLSTGEIRRFSDHYKLPDLEQMFSILLVAHKKNLLKLTGLLITQNQTDENAKQAFFERLENLTSARNHRLLSTAVDPTLDEFIHIFVDQLVYWQQQGWLPALNGLDCYQHLQSCALYALVSDIGADRSIAQFLPALIGVLARQYGVHSNRFEEEVIRCLKKRSPAGKFDGQLLAYFDETAKNRNDTVSTKGINQNLSQIDKNQFLIAALRDAGSSRTNELQMRLDELWIPRTANEFESFLHTVGRQIDAGTLLRSLLKWSSKPLTKLLSDLGTKAGLTEFGAIMDVLRAALQKVGQFKNSSRSLTNRLSEIVGLCLCDEIMGSHQSFNANTGVRLIQSLILGICHELRVPKAELVASVSYENGRVKNQDIAAAITAMSTTGIYGIESIDKALAEPYVEAANNYADHAQTEIIFLSLLRHGRQPLCLKTGTPLNARRICDDLLDRHPHRLKALISEVSARSAANFRLNKLFSYQHILSVVGRTCNVSQSTLKTLGDLYKGLGQLKISGIPASVIQALLFQQTLRCWLADDWRNMTIEQMAAHLSETLTRDYGVDGTQYQQQLIQHRAHFPVALRLTEAADNQPKKGLIDLSKSKLGVPAMPPKPKAEKVNESEQNIPHLDRPITVQNAGLVILQDFVKTYFDRLYLLRKSDFLSDQQQRDAVHHLQYLATGHYHTEEQHLVLNKLLCGLDIRSPVEAGLDPDAQDRQTADSLIEAMIQYWSAIGSSSIDGFRGNWLVRQGSLKQHTDHWELIVETKPYDLLLQQAPVSFSIIKHPWMPKPINVSWPI